MTAFRLRFLSRTHVYRDPAWPLTLNDEPVSPYEVLVYPEVAFVCADLPGGAHVCLAEQATTRFGVDPTPDQTGLVSLTDRYHYGYVGRTGHTVHDADGDEPEQAPLVVDADLQRPRVLYVLDGGVLSVEWSEVLTPCPAAGEGLYPPVETGHDLRSCDPVREWLADRRDEQVAASRARVLAATEAAR